MAYETLQRSRVELRRRTLALPTRKPSSTCLKETLCNRKKMAYETLQDRVEFRRRTLAYKKTFQPQMPQSPNPLQQQKSSKKMKLCKDRVSNFDGGLWHFLQERLPAANASKPNPLQQQKSLKKITYETLQGSRVEFRRRTLALPASRTCLSPNLLQQQKSSKKIASETLQGSRVEFRRRTLALPARKPSSRKCLKAQTLCNTEKFEKKWLVKLYKDRVSNFDAGLWHFLQENLPAANASKSKPFTTQKSSKKMAYETLQGSRVEFRRRTLALQENSSRECLQAQTLCKKSHV